MKKPLEQQVTRPGGAALLSADSFVICIILKAKIAPFGLNKTPREVLTFLYCKLIGLFFAQSGVSQLIRSLSPFRPD